MIATSVHISSSSARMWQEMTIVLPIALSCSSSSRSSTRARGSSPLAGSSSTSSSGSWTSVRARLSRCFMPRDSELTIAARLHVEVDELEQAVDQAGPTPRGDPVAGGEELEVLVDAQVVVDAEHVGHVAEPPAHVAGAVGGVVPEDRQRPDVGSQQGGDHRERRRLAGPVGADEAEDRARRHGEIHGARPRAACRSAW